MLFWVITQAFEINSLFFADISRGHLEIMYFLA